MNGSVAVTRGSPERLRTRRALLCVPREWGGGDARCPPPLLPGTRKGPPTHRWEPALFFLHPLCPHRTPAPAGRQPQRHLPARRGSGAIPGRGGAGCRPCGHSDDIPEKISKLSLNPDSLSLLATPFCLLLGDLRFRGGQWLRRQGHASQPHLVTIHKHGPCRSRRRSEGELGVKT